jgi:hypothetical protein
MKSSLLIITLFARSVSSFAPHGNIGISRSTSQLQNARIDSAEAVTAAIAASKKFGATSKEARVAWDIVEEMDARDNSIAYGKSINEDECLLTESVDPECSDYDKKISELSEAMDKAKIHMDVTKKAYQELQNIKIPPPPKSEPMVMSDEMLRAVSEAKAASAKYGATSTEAKMMWETVEEIASNDSSEVVMRGTLEDECLLEMMNACEALEEISRVLNLEKSPSRYSG